MRVTLRVKGLKCYRNKRLLKLKKVQLYESH